jgi:hypothetical protein
MVEQKVAEEKKTRKDRAPQYFEAEGVEEIAKKLIPQYHKHLEHTPIIYLFNGGKMRQWAKIGSRSAKERVISCYYFVMEVNHAQWLLLTDEQRLALVDHELCHTAIDTETGEPSVIDHDIEEFGIIVSRHGLWRDSVKHFARTCSEQLELLTATS